MGKKKAAVEEEGAETKVNKSEAIRSYLKANPNAKNKDVIAALKEQGIEVTASSVSVMKRGTKKKAEGQSEGGAVGLTQIRAAAAFIKQCGGMEQAEQALKAAKSILDAAR